jgi:hypothetical protein
MVEGDCLQSDELRLPRGDLVRNRRLRSRKVVGEDIAPETVSGTERGLPKTLASGRSVSLAVGRSAQPASTAKARRGRRVARMTHLAVESAGAGAGLAP